MSTGTDIAWARRLVICCDGTWQSSVTSKENVPSNVTKLCRLIARIGVDKDNPAKKFNQIVYYDSGIGTGNLSSREAKRQGGLGAGLQENVIEAYNFIVQNYVPGDEIFCFGFSRGAFTTRAVAGLVSDIGVLYPVDMQFFPVLYRLYMTNETGKPFRKTEAWASFVHGKLTKKGEEWKKRGDDLLNMAWDDQKAVEAWEIRPHGLFAQPDSQKVKVVGVWDTVGSLGIPDVVGINMAWGRTKFSFHNVKLTENIEHAYQALALDERRRAFRPTLWYIPQDLVDDPNRKTPELKQVWFPGVHINCGGGNDDAFTTMRSDSENISTATLCWMLQCISPHLTIDQNAFQAWIAQYLRWLARIRYACTYHHETFSQKVLSYLPNIPFINPSRDELAPFLRDPSHAHPHFDFSWGTGPLVDPFGGLYHLNGTHKRMPGHEDVERWDEKAKESLWGPLRDLGQTNEYIHPIVYHRSLVHGWDTHSPLQTGWKREHWQGKDGRDRFWWYMDGEKETCAIPEWAVLRYSDAEKKDNFERYWYEQCEPSEKTKSALAKLEDFRENKFLEALDRKIDFKFDNKPQNLWP